MGRRPQGLLRAIAIGVASTILASSTGVAQTSVRDRITSAVEFESTVQIKGSVHPWTMRASDLGVAPDSLQMDRMIIVFNMTPAQEADLDALLSQQQEPGSPNYKRWLTPDEFANRFGLSAKDVDRVSAWLRSRGFTINEVAQSRQWIAFSGTAQMTENAIQTRIHEFSKDGETYYANVDDPLVPAALKDVVLGFRSLNNFRLQPRPSPRFTSSISGNHYLSPNDFATIYDLNGLYANGANGSGQSIAVMGQSDFLQTDISAFRAASGLAANNPQVLLVPGSRDPGIKSGDVDEASLDVEWSGAIAPNAQIIFVNSGNGAFDSLQYAVDENIAPVISISYGACESDYSAQDMNTLIATAKQANSQGMTIVAASGDSGAADCESSGSTIATTGLAVDAPASLPYVTGMGGSEFTESASSWSATNNSSNGSVLSYLPEEAWNDTATAGEIAAGGGGQSAVFTKPSWQTGSGVPADGARDVPDLSFNASADHDGYLLCLQGSCVNGFRASNSTLTVVGGTSAAAPTFAAVVAILNQETKSIQGNLNSTLYGLAQTAPSAFHDITSGNNQVPCKTGSTNCPTSGVIGYKAGPGYDQATGLGSIDVGNFLSAWILGSVQTPTTPAPTITGLTPAAGVQGSTVSATLTGSGLTGATSVTFSGSGVTATIQSGGTASQVPLSIAIASNATPQADSVTVTTPDGAVTANSIFTVQFGPPANTTPLPIAAVEQGTVQTGYVVITPDSGVAAPVPTMTFGIVSGGVVQAQAGLSPSSMSTAASLFADVVPGIGRDLGVAIANPGSSANVISLSLQDQNGLTVQNGTTFVTLQPQQQLALYVSQLFKFGTSTIGSAFSGTLQLESSTPFSVLGLPFSGSNFSTLPTVETASVAGAPARTLAGGANANAPLAGTVGGNAAIVIPQFAMGGHWASEVALFNNGTTTITGRVDIFDVNGNPLPVQLNNALQSTFRYSIAAGGVFLLAPRDANGQSPF